MSRHADEQKYPKKGQGKPKSQSSFSFHSFQPTLQQKTELKAEVVTPESLTKAVTVVTDWGLVIKLKADTRKFCFCLLLLEDVPFGEPCRCLSFWHSDITVLLQQFIYCVPQYVGAWLEGDLPGQEGTDVSW
jgi:hypothetical protein